MTTDERLDAIDLEIIGLRRLMARETRDKLEARGFDVTNYRPVPFPHPRSPDQRDGSRGKPSRVCVTRLSRGRRRGNRSSSARLAARCSACGEPRRGRNRGRRPAPSKPVV